MVSRRGFLKLFGGVAAAAIVAPVLPKIVMPSPTAPLFIPSQNLDMGVPRRILTATEMPTAPVQTMLLPPGRPPMIGTIPMLLVQSEYSPPFWQQFGSQKVPAGTTLYVDESTARRWTDRGIAVPGASAPRELQQVHAYRRLQKQNQEDERRETDKYWQSGAWMEGEDAPVASDPDARRLLDTLITARQGATMDALIRETVGHA